MNSYSNILSVTSYLLRDLGISHTVRGLKSRLEDHPEHPSLLSVADVLTEWAVPNEALHLEPEELDEVPLPFIAHLRPQGGRFVLVTKYTCDSVWLSDEKKFNVEMDVKEFQKEWTGVVLYAAKDRESGEPNFRQQQQAEWIENFRLPTLLLLLSLWLFTVIDYNNLAGGTLILMLLKFIGCGVTTLLLVQSVDTSNPLIQNLCGLGNNNDCNAILKSDAAKLTPWLSWSEVGFFYFFGSFLTLLVLPNISQGQVALSLIAWLNVFALPYTIYSISYQYRHKNWCVLCCTIQVILILEAVSTLTLGSYNFSIEPSELFISFMCFATPLISWSFFKPFFIRSSQIFLLQQQLKQFKYNSNLFEQALKNQPFYAVSDELRALELGNPNGKTVITIVSNPFCDPCAKAHQFLDDWMKQCNDLKLNVIFTTADDDDDQRTKVARHLSLLSRACMASQLETALNDWYTQGEKSYERWAERYPVQLTEENWEVTQKQKAWCTLAEISFTPTILINGYKLPEPYRLEDIKYLITS